MEAAVLVGPLLTSAIHDTNNSAGQAELASSQGVINHRV